MSEYRIASRYAKSLLDLAVEQKNLEDIKNDVDLIATVCKENRDFVLLLNNPIVKNLQKAEIFKKIFKGKVSDATLSFLDIVARKRRESVLPEMTKVFNSLYNDYKGIISADITTTFPLDKSLREQVINIIKEISKKEVALNEKVDESLIGGFVIKVGDRQVDESVQHKLNSLRRELTQ